MSIAKIEAKFPAYLVAKQVGMALAEDLNNSVDWTANLIDASQEAQAYIKTNQNMVVCGQQWATAAFKLCNAATRLEWLVAEGQAIQSGQQLCRIIGQAQSLLTAERTALNFLQTLSATATLTRRYVELLNDRKVKIMDTRKTIPGLRLAQKYAVTVGGGSNQRIGLFDGVLIKENHILAHGGIAQVLTHAFNVIPRHIPIQIEVENLTELDTAIQYGAKLILLDNMSISEIQQAVIQSATQQVVLEVSGNITLDTVLDYANTGISRISIGSLTKNLQACDLSMRFI